MQKRLVSREKGIHSQPLKRVQEKRNTTRSVLC